MRTIKVWILGIVGCLYVGSLLFYAVTFVAVSHAGDWLSYWAAFASVGPLGVGLARVALWRDSRADLFAPVAELRQAIRDGDETISPVTGAPRELTRDISADPGRLGPLRRSAAAGTVATLWAIAVLALFVPCVDVPLALGAGNGQLALLLAAGGLPPGLGCVLLGWRFISPLFVRIDLDGLRWRRPFGLAAFAAPVTNDRETLYVLDCGTVTLAWRADADTRSVASLHSPSLKLCRLIRAPRERMDRAVGQCRSILIASSLAAGLLLALSSCGPAERLGIQFVTFTATTSYDDALRLVTDVGLQLRGPCGFVTLAGTSDASVAQPPSAATAPSINWAAWHAQSQRDGFASADEGNHTLSVVTTPAAPPDWADRLRQQPAVRDVQPDQRTYACPNERYSTTPPAANEDAGLPPQQVGVYARLRFPTPSYAAALDQTTNLGLRLADPCYERAVAGGHSAAWHPMGQEQAFKIGQTFVVATTAQASTRWQDQVKALPATVDITPNATDHCGASARSHHASA